MLGHHDVTDHHKPVGNASFFEDSKKHIAAGGRTKPWITLIATDGDEVKILGSIITMQAGGHETSLRPASNSEFSGRKFFLLVVSFPKSIAHPFAKSAKGWGTPAYTPCRRWATRLARTPDVSAVDRLAALLALTHLELVFLAQYFPSAILGHAAADPQSTAEFVSDLSEWHAGRISFDDVKARLLAREKGTS